MQGYAEWLNNDEKQKISEIDERLERVIARKREYTAQKRKIMRLGIARKRRAEGKT